MTAPPMPAPRSATAATGGPAPQRRADAQRNRARVLDAARAAFAAEGSNVSLDEIAGRAGVGAGTVYRHFSTKQALLEAVVVDRLETLAAEAGALLDDPDPGPGFFAFIERLSREGATKRDVVEAFGRAGLDVQLGVAKAVQDLADALDAPLRRAQDAGAVRADVGVDDVIAIATGAASAISRSDEAGGRVVLAVICDGLRPTR